MHVQGRTIRCLTLPIDADVLLSLALLLSVLVRVLPVPSWLRMCLATETALKSAEVVHRMGKKLDGKYALVTAFLRDDKVRVVAYLQETSTKMEILVTYGASLSAGTDADKVDAIKNLVGALSIDGSGKLTLGESQRPVQRAVSHPSSERRSHRSLAALSSFVPRYT